MLMCLYRKGRTLFYNHIVSVPHPRQIDKSVHANFNHVLGCSRLCFSLKIVQSDGKTPYFSKIRQKKVNTNREL